MMAPLVASCHQLPGCRLLAPIGMTLKLCVRVAMTIRWPLIAMNTSNASRPRNSETTTV
ncbi:MAG: hypothetical protein AW07_03793 [Candidatus Accumulibacter sp. SK-11]|nr:MAG: hypothetical protein AW07_03793 [Candidatus Accumulibacter sp. SK-11]